MTNVETDRDLARRLGTLERDPGHDSGGIRVAAGDRWPAYSTDPAAMLLLIEALVSRGYRVDTRSHQIDGIAYHGCLVWAPGEGEPTGDEEGSSLPLVAARAALAALAAADTGER